MSYRKHVDPRSVQVGDVLTPVNRTSIMAEYELAHKVIWIDPWPKDNPSQWLFRLKGSTTGKIRHHSGGFIEAHMTRPAKS